MKRSRSFTERPQWALLSCLPLLFVAACSDSAAGSGGAAVVGTGGSSGPVLAMEAADPDELWALPEELLGVPLTERSGAAVSLGDLAGTPYACTFVFTRCGGPCPRITADMAWLQKELGDVEARLVSFTVDPGYDTPEVLARYAEKFEADSERWWFLTAEPDVIRRVSKEAFFQPLEIVESEIAGGDHPTHGTRVIAVDGSGRVRGVYDTNDRGGRTALRDRMLWLADPESEPSE